MAVGYKKLWHLLLNRNMTKGDLEKAAGVSHYTITQMGKGKDVRTKAIRNICSVLDCNIDDIMEFVSENKEQELRGERIRWAM